MGGPDRTPPAVRRRVALELGSLVVLTPIFLYFAPRGMGLYSGAALLFLGFIALTAKETKERIWGLPAEPGSKRLRRCTLTISILTIPAVVTFLAWGMWKGHQVEAVNLLLGLSIYFPWALLQQTIFQFYLLGRLRVLLPLPGFLLAVLNGFAYGLVHLPDVPVALLTIIGGIFWSYSYLRDRYIFPLAVSHALLGTTFYYAVIGRDLFHELTSHLSRSF